jgi:hypothetical protein
MDKAQAETFQFLGIVKVFNGFIPAVFAVNFDWHP